MELQKAKSTLKGKKYEILSYVFDKGEPIRIMSFPHNNIKDEKKAQKTNQKTYQKVNQKVNQKENTQKAYSKG